MKEIIQLKRTNSDDVDFKQLVEQLDDELWNKLNENQAVYDQYNKVVALNTVIVAYENNQAIGCGCFKQYKEDTIELKRMYVQLGSRGKGVAAAILTALENWAIELNYTYAILETGKNLLNAQKLYAKQGYIVIANYDQYIGLTESVCMQKKMQLVLPASEFANLQGIEYFNFEEDFIEDNVRCIPMIVRFKMDAAGIKLKLAEWSKFTVKERQQLALQACTTKEEAAMYKTYLKKLVLTYTGKEATPLQVEAYPEWQNLDTIDNDLQEKALTFGWLITITQWKALSNLQRFILLKLCKPGHENKNFPKAMQEFGWEGVL